MPKKYRYTNFVQQFLSQNFTMSSVPSLVQKTERKLLLEHLENGIAGFFLYKLS